MVRLLGLKVFVPKKLYHPLTGDFIKAEGFKHILKNNLNF